MSYEEARALAQANGIQSRPQWADFVKTRSPRDVPAAPAVVYKDCWTSWGEFLGTGRIADRDKNAGFLSYEEAKRYLRPLGFQSEAEFYAWAKTPDRPVFIPASPRKTYNGKGWISMGDFLGNGNMRTKDFLPFEEARAYARSLQLRNQAEWVAWAKSGERPDNIPHKPMDIYADSGWAGLADWLGYERKTSYGEKIIEYFLKTNNIEYRPQAKFDGCQSKILLRFDFAIYEEDKLRALLEFHGIQHYQDIKFFNSAHTRRTDKIKRDFCQKNDIPLIEMSYRDLERVDMFFHQNLAPLMPYAVFKSIDRSAIISNTHWMDFYELRAYVRSLELPSIKAFLVWRKHHRPLGCPSDVVKVYRHKGWVSWVDFLGLRKSSPKNARDYMMSYEECQLWMLEQGVTSSSDWKRRAKEKPINVPANPSQFYGRTGEWHGWKEFLMPSETPV